MISRRTLVLCAACAAVLPAGALQAAPDPKGDPFTYLVDLSNVVLDEIRKNPALHKADPEQVRRLVDETLMPAADFEMMTRMTVGPRWRKASAEERAELMGAFKALLVRVYSGALTTVEDHRCELRPTRNKKVRGEMIVRTLLKSAGRNDIGLDYRIYRDKTGTWRIVDVNVEGIWMVENYRSQFAPILSQEGVAGLITALKTKSDQFVKKDEK